MSHLLLTYKNSVSCFNSFSRYIPASNYMFKVNHRNTRTKCEICSELTVKVPERRHCRCSGIFIVNFEHISHLVLVFLLLNLNMYLPAGLKPLLNGTLMVYSEKICTLFKVDNYHLYMTIVFLGKLKINLHLKRERTR